MSNSERFKYLFDLHFNRAASAEEREKLFALVHDNEHDAELKELIEAYWDKELPVYEQDETRANEIFEQIVKQPSEQATVKKLLPWRRIVAAACLIGILFTGYWVYKNSLQGPQGGDRTTIAVNDVAPGKDKAVLTLGNGKQIVLDSTTGTISKDGDVTVINLNGKLSYEAGNGKLEVSFNTISTPKGGQYQLILADGSKVWLNAASSLRYPTAFIGSIREVELNGEGYFEIAPLALKGGGKMPFHVKSNGQDVEVLGTHFNINAYANEGAIKTTLLEGSVKVKSEVGSKKSVVIKPGQQSVLRQAQNDIQVQEDADTEQAVAWKNGKMSFHNASMETILREIERWYDVDVEIKGNLGNQTFFFDVRRTVMLSELLHVFDVNKIHYEIDGMKKKLVVMQ